MRGTVFVALALGLLLSGCTFFGPAAEQCGTERAYVCGSDGNTYTNACYARQANVSVAYEGSCAPQQQEGQPGEQCVDSDNGKNALEAGAVSMGTAGYNDSCAGTTAVFEYYCANNEIKSERVECPEGTECSAGRCASPACIDSDGGQVAGEAGTTARGAERRTDECADANSVREYYCTASGAISSTVLACGSGKECRDGACSAIACTDSDGGMDIFERGTVREGSGVYADYCSGTSSVKEYYCSGGRMVQTTASCGDGYYCSDGICVEYTCRDSDGGRDEDEFGTVTKGSEEWEDDCYDSGTVKEYYCDGNEVKSERRSCGSSETCSGGECVRISCTDTDGGNKRGVLGTATSGSTTRTDQCEDLYTLREYFCGGTGVDYADILCTGYGELCWNGICSPATCEDSDGGEDSSVRGWVRVSTSNGYSDTQNDECSGSRNVLEKYCSGLSVQTRTMECEDYEECENGRCIEAVCEDSDGGKNYIVAGTVTKGALSYTDKCVADDIIEYYCSGNNPVSERYRCPAGCTTDRSGVAYCVPL